MGVAIVISRKQMDLKLFLQALNHRRKLIPVSAPDRETAFIVSVDRHKYLASFSKIVCCAGNALHKMLRADLDQFIINETTDSLAGKFFETMHRMFLKPPEIFADLAAKGM